MDSSSGDLHQRRNSGRGIRWKGYQAAPCESAIACIRDPLLGMGDNRRALLRDLLRGLESAFAAAKLASPERSFRPARSVDVCQRSVELLLFPRLQSPLRLPNRIAV